MDSGARGLDPSLPRRRCPGRRLYSHVGLGLVSLLAKPGWTPPSAVFGPVWTVLYLMMGLALWLVWSRAGSRPVRRALWLFGAQLALNFAWSPLFFGLQSPGAGLVAIGALWLALAAAVFAFWRVERVAGVLLLPYWAWVSYAAALNWAIWRLNL